MIIKSLSKRRKRLYEVGCEINSKLDINISDLIKTEVAKEHHAEIDNARNLLKSHKPKTALSY